mmetsp:Transcript_45718/g.126804  ORF Transcript_45718/g.126804 Transcript_45718/m.126804 type:complete len:250 (+) Transcript_45718:985-1734(+)
MRHNHLLKADRRGLHLLQNSPLGRAEVYRLVVHLHLGHVVALGRRPLPASITRLHVVWVLRAEDHPQYGGEHLVHVRLPCLPAWTVPGTQQRKAHLARVTVEIRREAARSIVRRYHARVLGHVGDQTVGLRVGIWHVDIEHEAARLIGCALNSRETGLHELWLLVVISYEHRGVRRKLDVLRQILPNFFHDRLHHFRSWLARGFTLVGATVVEPFAFRELTLVTFLDRLLIRVPDRLAIFCAVDCRLAL